MFVLACMPKSVCWERFSIDLHAVLSTRAIDCVLNGGIPVNKPSTCSLEVLWKVVS